MSPIFLLLIFVVVTYGIGRKALSFFRIELSELEEVLIGIALGTGFLIYFTIFLGTVHLLYKEAYIFLAAAAIALCWREIKHLKQLAVQLGMSIKEKLKPNIAGALLLAYAFFMLINILPALAPVSEFDSLAYHLAFAKTYAGSHALVYQPSHLYTTMPQGMSMIYTIAEIFSAPNLSSLIAYSFGIFASLAIYALVRKRHSEPAALIGSLLFFTAPAVMERLPQTAVDVSQTYFFLTGVIVLLKYVAESDDGRKTSLAILFSVLIGIAASIKLTGLALALAVVIGMTFSWLLYRQRFEAKRTIKHIVIFGLIVIVLMSPWLVRGYAYTGNPLYPQAYTIFGGKYINSQLTQLYAGFHETIGLERNLLNALLVPWNITFNSKAFGTIIGLTPFFVMMLPLALVFRKQMSDIKSWGIIFATGIIILAVHFWVHPVLRYMFPGVALLSVSTAMVMDAMMKSRQLKAAIFVLMAASLVFSAAIWYGINAKNINYFVSGESEGEYYARLSDHNSYGAAAWINANTAQDSVVLLFSEQRGYFLDRKYVMSSPLSTYVDYNGMNSTADFLKRLSELGISYILINDELPDDYSRAAKGSNYVDELLRNFLKEHTQMAYERNQVRVYRIMQAA
ncbi:glycosyltransferase family 39 protein [Candidatus Woesearchaeota archaeon]|nr:glycosyltransferase family 39 protein [Candidatus Woesearchaeota archaeon]